MLIVLKCVNDSMHQIAITGFWVSWSAAEYLGLQHKLWECNTHGSKLGSMSEVVVCGRMICGQRIANRKVTVMS
jgi:hypothetical protein